MFLHSTPYFVWSRERERLLPPFRLTCSRYIQCQVLVRDRYVAVCNGAAIDDDRTALAYNLHQVMNTMMMLSSSSVASPPVDRAPLLLLRKVTGFEKGVLNCDSLELAEDAPVLRFGLANSEVRRLK